MSTDKKAIDHLDDATAALGAATKAIGHVYSSCGTLAGHVEGACAEHLAALLHAVRDIEIEIDAAGDYVSFARQVVQS